MKGGDLRHRVVIEHQPAPQTRNGLGEVTTPWVELATVWAAVEPLTGSEAIQQAREEAQVSHRVRIRRRTDVTPAMRVVYGAKVFNILAVLDANKPGETQLACREVVEVVNA